MVLLYTLFVGGVLWVVSMQTALEPVANRRIFGVLAASLYVVGFSFIWLTTLTWCAVERRRAAAGELAHPTGDGAALPVHDVATPGAVWRAGWWWQAVLILLALWFGTGSVEPGAGLVSGRGVLTVLLALLGLGVVGYLVMRADLPQRMGRWMTALVPVAIGAVLYLVLNALIEWVGLGGLVERFNDNVLSVAVFIVSATFVALLLGGILRRRGGEVPSSAQHAQHERLGPPAPADVGWALAPMLSPVVAFACLHYLPMDTWWKSAVASHGQVGLTFHAMLLPMFPAALLVAWGIDRRNGEPGSALVPLLAGTGLIFVALFGPEVIRQLHPHPEGLHAAGGLPSDPFWNWDPAQGGWVRLPVDGLMRASAIMLLATAALSATFLTKLGREGRGATPGALLMLLVLQIVLAAIILPKFGPLGAPLAAAIAAGAVWLYEVLSGDGDEAVAL